MKTVLVVDDDIPIAQLLSVVLTDAGYNVVTAFDGEKGLASISCSKPDVVLSNTMMPQLDGIGLCKILRADPTTDKIPFILMSAVDPGQIPESCEYTALISKPFSIQTAIDTVGSATT